MNEQLWVTDKDEKYLHPVPYWEAIFRKQLVYWIRKNWPLKSKFNKIALKASQPGLGFTTFLKKKYLDKIVKKKYEEEKD
ncbi:hypothetical protein KQX54_021180 [Cotesia glomerata]|uniref:Uncharacterized protein n=1 Tax=Cotesia glomerata TaxID=32391 RepID=A0AAV7J9Q3_COTGL|nr:hypothetical protein KQX54_021180 [Cotesia glomerata]